MNSNLVESRTKEKILLHGKRFIFINLSIECGYNTGINHGIAYLTSLLKKRLYEVACLNIRHEISVEDFIDKINDFQPSIVGFSCTSHQFKYLMRYSKEIDKSPGVLQIAGGVGPTLDPEFILDQSSVKGVCVGEGEIPLSNLLDDIDNQRDIFDTKGFFWRKDNEIKKNGIPQFITDLSSLDFPDYSIFEKEITDSYGYLLITLSRGCPFDCHYCCNKALAQIYPDPKSYSRLPSVEHSIRLIERLIEQYPKTKFILFQDDLLIADKIWFEDFAWEYRKRIGIPYRTCARAECIDPGIIAALKLSGCRWVYLGLESGSESLRAKLLNRKYSNRMFIEKVRMIKNSGMSLYTYNIVGFPFETKEQLNATFKLNKQIGPHAGVCTFFYPYKHTALYKICKESELLKNPDEILEITNYNSKPSIKMDRFQKKNCIYFQKKITRYLVDQDRLNVVAGMSFGLKKSFSFIYYRMSLFLPQMPLLGKIRQRARAYFKKALVSSAEKKFFIALVSCEIRRLDAERIKNYFLANGVSRAASAEEADYLVVVTCGFPKENVDRCIRYIEDFKKLKKKLVVYGCLSAMEPERLSKVYSGLAITPKEIEQLDRFFPEFRIKFNDVNDANKAFKGISVIQRLRYFKKSDVNPVKIFRYIVKCLRYFIRQKNTKLEYFDDKLFTLRILEGCRGSCSYCSIKKAIGKLESKPLNLILDELKKGVIAKQYRFNIVSTDTGSYGLDIESNLPTLLWKILKEDKRVIIEYIGGLNPAALCRYKDDFINLLKTKRIRSMESAIQSGNSRVLQLMHRDLDLECFKNTIIAMRRVYPELKIKTQVIVGFPTETEEEFLETVIFLQECKFDAIGISGYSELSGSASVKLFPKIEASIIRKRIEKLRASV